MRAFLFSVLLAVVGGGAWLLASDGAPSTPELALPEPDGGAATRPSAAPVRTLDVPLNVVVAPVEPPGLFFSPEDETGSLFAQADLMRETVELPKDSPVLTGEMLLRAFASVAGKERPFRFGGQAALEAFKALEWPMPPPHRESIQGLLALCPMKGWRPMLRGGEYWMVSLEGRD